MLKQCDMTTQASCVLETISKMIGKQYKQFQIKLG